jgi:uncharacterized protein (DUF608 family)
VASEMMAEGMTQEGYATAKGIYNGVYERFGYWFRTPEAWGLDGHYRASMYMRPGAIWSMEIVNEEQAAKPHTRAGGATRMRCRDVPHPGTNTD